MKKTVIVNIPMTMRVQQKVYESKDISLPVSERAVGYPIISFLERTMQAQDRILFLLLVKKGPHSQWKERVEEFQHQMEEANQHTGAHLDYRIIESDFSEEREVHEQLMYEIVDHMEEDAHVIADITFGPKDLPIVVFTALNFMERFCGCQIDHILYGQGVFNEEGVLEQNTLCDLSLLYALNTLMGTLQCQNGAQAKAMLKTIIEM